MSQKRKLGDFSIGLTIWQDAWDQTVIGERLGLASWFSAEKGRETGPVIRKRGVWMAKVAEGGAEVFSEALETVFALVTERAEFFTELAAVESDAELLLDLFAEREDDPAQLLLNADFLRVCGEAGIALRIKSWNISSE